LLKIVIHTVHSDKCHVVWGCVQCFDYISCVCAQTECLSISIQM